MRFAHQLALKMGIFDVELLLESMSEQQFLQWFELYKQEPWGFEWERLMAGQICATTANRHRNKNEKLHKIKEFFPEKFTSKPKQQTWQEQFALMSGVIEKFEKAKKGLPIDGD